MTDSDFQLSRISKLLVDRDQANADATLARRKGYAVMLVCGDDVAASYTLQLAVLTAAEIASRCFPGAIQVSLRPKAADAPLALIDASTDNRALGRSTDSFHLYALADEDMRQRVVDGSHKIFTKMETTMVNAFGREALGMPPRKFVPVLLAVTEGLLARRHLMPEEFSPDVVYAALDALAVNGK